MSHLETGQFPASVRAGSTPESDAIAATCLSVAAAGLAAELGMVDRELNQKIRESLARREATEPAPVQH